MADKTGFRRSSHNYTRLNSQCQTKQGLKGYIEIFGDPFLSAHMHDWQKNEISVSSLYRHSQPYAKEVLDNQEQIQSLESSLRRLKTKTKKN